MAKRIHTEQAFEAFIEGHLLRHGGYQSASPDSFDTERAILPTTVIAFIRTTQPKTWTKLVTIHKEHLTRTLLVSLCKVLEERGLLSVLRHGFKFYGQFVRLAYFEPENSLNAQQWNLYEKNQLSVVRQLRYDPNNDNSLDLALFLNGLPIVTAELKNAMTGQTARDAIMQYQQDRNPRVPLFRWHDGPKRSLVHFAVDTDEVWMCTQLRGSSSIFLPFNRGDSHGKGNPTVQGKHRTYYLWEEIWERHSLLDLIGRFMHLQSDSKVDPATGTRITRKILIFPRYHQLDCVRKLVQSTLTNGAGTNYLVQHSAGSGKSKSIAWLAHRLASLHDTHDEKVYDGVVVLTDRRVLDQQLQETIHQFEHKSGVVEKIDKDSTQLASALESGVPIIVSTIHKFGFIQNRIGDLPNRRYAIIVDEAHSSQSGEMAANVKEILSDASITEKIEQDADDISTPDQWVLRAALSRGPQPNLSFFAFTATPKFKTLEMFGHKSPDGTPAPFHLYSMRQAIEEGFILDVLNGYTTYTRFFKLTKAVADDPSLDKRKAAAALIRFVNLHPSNIAQKTEIVIEHFRKCIKHRLEGKAKAMLVTGSRLQAVKYKLAFDKYIRRHKLSDVSCLVAFSGEVADDQFPATTWTEQQMNCGILETELPDKFSSNAYQVLIVANKYQTGFDQPLLCAMYVDKRLRGIQAVQTISRLNRQHHGKESTFVLDFVNDRAEIVNSFQDYYEVTSTDEAVDPQRLYQLQYELEEFQVWTSTEIDGFASVFFALPLGQKLTDHAELNAWLDPAVDRFRRILASSDESDESDYQQSMFRRKLVAFRNLYGFLAQIVPFHDIDLEKVYAYGRMLIRKLPRPKGGQQWEPGEDVELSSLKLKKEEEDSLSLQAGKSGELSGPSFTGTTEKARSYQKLSTILDILNRRHGTDFRKHVTKILEGVADTLASDETIQRVANANDKDNFGLAFQKPFENALVDHYSENGRFVNQVYDDEAFGRSLVKLMADFVYDQILYIDGQGS